MSKHKNGTQALKHLRQTRKKNEKNEKKRAS